MVYGFYEFADEWGNRKNAITKINGHNTEAQALKAIQKRGGVGYITNHKNMVLSIIRNGEIVKYE